MAAGAGEDRFYRDLPRWETFADLSRPESYTPLPDGWMLGVADIVGSTGAIGEGRYKSVNMVGSAVISAAINALPGVAFPFVFGGDGAALAVPPGAAGATGRAMAAVRCWARDAFGLDLRVALVSVAAIRAAGADVAVARHRVSSGLDYAMFAGGGLSWAEAEMKAGRVALPEAEPGTRPDLTGLSCRWSHMRARNGTILSVMIEPAEGCPEREFARLAEQVIATVRRLRRDGHPFPEEGPAVAWPEGGLALEAHAGPRPPGLGRRLRLLLDTAFAWVVLRSGLRIGGFDPTAYRREVAANADFRKFDDGLKMTLDCDTETLAELRDLLEEARAAGLVDYGLVEQDAAMMTCIVPSATQGDHIHFVDGAAGGYALAAARMKRAAVR